MRIFGLQHRQASIRLKQLRLLQNYRQFYFITIFPHSSSNERANVNIRVEHRNLEPLQTKLYLSSRNIAQNECGETNPSLVTVQDEMQVYYFDVIVSGTTLKRY